MECRACGHENPWSTYVQCIKCGSDYKLADDCAAKDKRIEELEGIVDDAAVQIRVDAERLIAAADKAGVAFVGCDTPDALAERVKELEREREGFEG